MRDQDLHRQRPRPATSERQRPRGPEWMTAVFVVPLMLMTTMMVVPPPLLPITSALSFAGNSRKNTPSSPPTTTPRRRRDNNNNNHSHRHQYVFSLNDRRRQKQIARIADRLSWQPDVPSVLIATVQSWAATGSSSPATTNNEFNVADISNLSPDVANDLVQAAALADYPSLACQWTQQCFLEKDCLPLKVTQDILWRSLRHQQDGTVSFPTMQTLWEQMITVAANQPHNDSNNNNVVSVTAYNHWLAALCEADRLTEACEWLLLQKRIPPSILKPDAVSFATLLQAATLLRNATLSDDLWGILRDKNDNDDESVPRPNVYCYNARLQALSQRLGRASLSFSQRPPSPSLRLFARGDDIDDIIDVNPNEDDENDDETSNNPKQRKEKRSYRILLVDDEASLRKAVGTYLEQAGGYQVTACNSSEAALTVLSKAPTEETLPDVIISDIRMPDSAMDGLALLRKIRESPAWVQLPVVMLTAKGQTQDRIAGYQAGADAYLPKPFAPEELLSIVEGLCDRSQRWQDESSVTVKDLQNQVADIKALLQKGGGGPGIQGYVEAPAVFLAPDERRVLELLCDGLPNKEIASKTFTSSRRVQQVLTSLFRKAGVSNRTELISAYCQGASSTTAAQDPVEEEMLQLWREMQDDSHIQPDRYTIDIMLPVWSRRHDSTTIEAVLDEFIKASSSWVVSNSFSAFMITLNKSGQPLVARSIFQTYIQPGLVRTLEADGLQPKVTPTIMHVNLLLDTYRKEILALQEIDGNNTRTESAENVSQEVWKLFNQIVEHPSIDPDDFTMSKMMTLSSSSQQICWLINYILKDSNQIPLVLQRSALTAFGKVNDASSAVWLFSTITSHTSRSSTREWNTFLGALSNTCRSENVTTISASDSVAAKLVGGQLAGSSSSPLVELLDGVTPEAAAEQVLHLMIQGVDDLISAPRPDTQSFCCVASALQYGERPAPKVIELYRQARQLGLPAEGRFVNSIFRCYGSDITSALDVWKTEIRPACLEYEKKSQLVPRRRRRRTDGKNLIAAYNGLLYCCGRALRPDIGLRLVYAMNKERLEPNETTLNCYWSGKRQSQSVPVENRAKALLQKVAFLDLYEPLLQVECTKYNQNDRRRSGEKRIRIIF